MYPSFQGYVSLLFPFDPTTQSDTCLVGTWNLQSLQLILSHTRARTRTHTHTQNDMAVTI